MSDLSPQAPAFLSFRTARWICALLLLIACALRVAGIFNDFWIDEIISWDIARHLHSATEIFTAVHNDNNHYLNTLWMYLLGRQTHWQVYRLLAVATGTISVALLGLLASKDGPVATVVAVLLGSTSYFLVQYSSEARGYAPAMMFALAAMLLLDRYLAKPLNRYKFGFAACVMLGVCSHLTFVYVYFALVVWSFAALRGRRKQFLLLHAVPVVFCVALYLLDIRQMNVAAGPVYPRWRVLLDTAAWMTGAPRIGVMPWIAAGVFEFTFAIGLLVLTRQSPLRALFYATVILLAPAVMLLAWRQPYLYPRYFVLCAPFYYLLIAKIAAAIFDSAQKHLAPKIACAAFLLLFLAGNARFLFDFYRTGRGQYLAAIDYMLAARANNTSVGALQDRRNALMIEFYQPYLPPGAHLEFRNAVAATAEPPDWLIVDGLDWSIPDLANRLLPSGACYTFDRDFPYAGLSGFHWYLFRRIPAVAAPRPASVQSS